MLNQLTKYNYLNSDFKIVSYHRDFMHYMYKLKLGLDLFGNMT